jgi:hypothetical protein
LKIPAITTQAELDTWLAEVGKDGHSLSLVTDALDEFVHEVKSREATDVNNGGVDEQVGFLLDTIVDVSGLVRMLSETLEEDE